MGIKEDAEWRYKNRKEKTREFLKYMLDNPNHDVKLLNMWSRSEAQIICKDTCYEPYMDFSIEEDDIPHAFLNFYDVLEALNIKEM